MHHSLSLTTLLLLVLLSQLLQAAALPAPTAQVRSLIILDIPISSTNRHTQIAQSTSSLASRPSTDFYSASERRRIRQLEERNAECEGILHAGVCLHVRDLEKREGLLLVARRDVEELKGRTSDG